MINVTKKIKLVSHLFHTGQLAKAFAMIHTWPDDGGLPPGSVWQHIDLARMEESWQLAMLGESEQTNPDNLTQLAEVLVDRGHLARAIDIYNLSLIVVQQSVVGQRCTNAPRLSPEEGMILARLAELRLLGSTTSPPD